MNRRQLIAALGIGVFSTTTLGTHSARAVEPSIISDIDAQVIYKRGSIIYRLPRSSRRRMAWTIDDGTDTRMINSYLQLAKKHNLRLTFFVYSGMKGWKTLSPKLRPMVESGQIQIANHTARHLDLTQLSTHQIQKELWDCHQFILKNYGIDARPFFRPPYGAINRRVVRAAAAIGYTSPVMWSGTLADATRISTSGIWNKARLFIGNEVILLAHANNTKTTHLYGKILRRIRSKRLRLVTLNDAFAKAPKPPSIVRAELADSTITVTWSTVTNAQFYVVSYQVGDEQKIAEVRQGVFTVADVVAGSTYQFKVAASVFGVTSDYSATTTPITIETPIPDPVVPG